MVFTSKYPNLVSVTQLGHHLRGEAISSSARGARDRSVVPSSWAVPAAGQTSAGNFRILKWSYCNYRKTIVCRDITLHRPYIGLIIYIYICGRYLQFRFLKWPLKNWLRRSGVLEYGKLEIPIINIDGILVGNSWNLREFYSKPCLIREELLGGQRFLGVKLSTNRADGGGP